MRASALTDMTTITKRGRQRRTFAELCAAIDRADADLAIGLRNEDRTMIASARSARSVARRELRDITQPTLL